jgi:photosystem II stability/assembly factor-like uncharacterized protein
MGLAAVAATSAAAATPTPSPYSSAIGNELPLNIVVSPAYAKTGLVLAVSAQQGGCQQDCVHLWRSRDGGNRWERLHPIGWSQGNMSIAVDGAGHETIVTSGGGGLLRSTDEGQTWTAAGGAGTPTADPTNSGDIAVASFTGKDYVLGASGTQRQVAGSHGAASDIAFAYSPDVPRDGRYSPGLLVGQTGNGGALVVLRCDATLSCTSPAPVASAAPGYTAAASRLYPANDFATSGSVFLFTQRGVLKSIDGGTTFTPLAIVSNNGAQTTATPMMALGPNYRESGTDRAAYVAVLQAYVPASADKSNPPTTAGGIYETTDGGSSWTPLGANQGYFHGATAVAVAPDGRLFAGWLDGRGHAGLVCSTEVAAWQPICPSHFHDTSSGSGGSQNNGGSGVNAATSPCTGNCSRSGGQKAQSVSGENGVGAINPSGTKTSTVATGGSAKSWGLIAGIIAVVLAIAAPTSRFIRGRRRSGTEPVLNE